MGGNCFAEFGQSDGTVGLTPAPCLRRVRRLEADGVITGYTATVDPAALGREFEVIINADLVAKDLATVEAFEERVAAMDEIAELRRMFGIPDYMIRVQVANAEIYERWLTTRLMGDPAIARVDSRITMKLIKGGPTQSNFSRFEKRTTGAPEFNHVHQPHGLDPFGRHRGSGGSCRRSELVFEVDRADNTDGRVASAPVVDSLDPVADTELRGYLGRP